MGKLFHIAHFIGYWWVKPAYLHRFCAISKIGFVLLRTVKTPFSAFQAGTRSGSTFACGRGAAHFHSQYLHLMPSIHSFEALAAHLSQRKERSRIAIVCGSDASTAGAAMQAVHDGLAEAIFVGDVEAVRQLPCVAQHHGDYVHFVAATSHEAAAAQAVALARSGEAHTVFVAVYVDGRLEFAGADVHMGRSRMSRLVARNQAITIVARMNPLGELSSGNGK